MERKLLLLLLTLGLFIHLSVAELIKCYDCWSGTKGSCAHPTLSSTATCTAEVCYQGHYEEQGISIAQ